MILTSKINKMRSFLLFLLVSLMKGCEASSEGSEESVVKGCPTEWLEFTCKYTATNRKYIDVVTPKESIKTTERNVWENKGVSLYNNTKNNNLRVVIKQLAHEDFGNYTCKFQDNEIKKLELEVETDGCQGQFNQTAYRTAKTTITCDYTGNKYKFFCKQNGSICEDISSTKSSLKSNGTFTLTETNSSFSVSISNVSSHDAGVYWCGVETHEGSYRAALRKIQLEVKAVITNFTRSPTVGQNFTYWCQYPNGQTYSKIFVCKGEDPSICQPLVTAQLNHTGKFSMKDGNKRNITITVRNVTANDTGTYWCGAESTNETISNKFFHRLVMTVSLSPVSSTQSTTMSAESRGGSLVVVTLIVCVVVLLLLLFVLILILIYKRFSHLKNTRKGAEAQNIREDYVYEEIQQHIQTTVSGNDMNTIYANVNFPTNSSASLHYSTVNFQSSSDRVGGEAVILKPISAACKYSTVKQNPSYWTVNQPSSSSAHYATLNRLQQQH
ncbi:uncharacterized protein LOC123956424 [Micropterus dolomieu]|uniref:uncharacterized protein LOC123956424 n=1 Tax=Micropterus dolomieu TaxID=147949 RepID=UPI001E8E52FC|nr:uncharacterized protein LOC123956424 [Micropterus dolomieu]